MTAGSNGWKQRRQVELLELVAQIAAQQVEKDVIFLVVVIFKAGTADDGKANAVGEIEVGEKIEIHKPVVGIEIRVVV